MEKRRKSAALLPVGVFLIFYLGLGILFEYIMKIPMGFYNVPIVVAFLAALLVACLQNRKVGFDEKLEIMGRGIGDKNIITMLLIFLTAGTFVGVVGRSSAESVAYFMLSIIPARFAVAVLFVVACFVSTAMGTSVGTITLLTPIAVAVSQTSGFSLALCVASVMGGSMFGDNLSFISDTTIAACNGQGCEMKDKFRENFKIALPAALVTFVLLLIFGRPETLPAVQEYSYNIIKVLPYIFVLVASLLGVNVFAVLTGGILFSGAIGHATGSFSALELANNVYNGFSGMFEIFLLSMITGGLAKMVEKEGGLEWLLQKISKVIKNRQTAELGIAVMTSLTNIATANNTVAILIDSTIAKDISKEYGVDPKRTASLLDIFACAFQGILPYGAQILFACALMENLNSPFQVITQCWYQFILMAFAILSIFFAKGVDTKKATN